MHAPDGFLAPGVAAVTAVISIAVTWLSLRMVADNLADRYIPLAGVTAAFVFAAQMVNVPVGAGTSGHLLGGALAALLLGPWLGSLVVTVVVLVQALVFADGGVTALGYNVLNMAIVPAFSAWAIFGAAKAVFPKTRGGVVGAGAIAAGLSVVLAAGAFSVEWLFGATAGVPFDRLFGAMVSVHAAIGVVEGLITGLVVAAVLNARPDIVEAARGVPDLSTSSRAVGMKPFLVGAFLAAVVLAIGVSQFASSSPDGLETVAAQQGIDEAARQHALANGVFADYATDGVGNETMSLAVAGFTGVMTTLVVAGGMLVSARALRQQGMS
ncbi:MAG: energy-coupling factor ABC transporter permease [Acidimicrobiia bacterium]|nr:energy-coupling factor ABC transporter permease [Acidimicrobiia bacterium]